MQVVKNRVKEIREKRGLSQDALGAMIGKARAQVSRIETGRQQLTTHWMNMLSKALQCSPGELVADIADEGRQIPVIGEVPGGDLAEAIQSSHHETFIRFNSNRPNLFALRVKGNSMSRIAPAGSYVIVDFDDNNPATLNNQPVIVCIHNEAVHECTFKIYKRNPDRFEPYSVEEGYDTIFPHGREWKIYGRVISVVGFIGEDAKMIEAY